LQGPKISDYRADMQSSHLLNNELQRNCGMDWIKSITNEELIL